MCNGAEKWANQDHIAQRESPKPEWLLDLLNVHVTLCKHKDIASYFQEYGLSFSFLPPLQNKILHLFYFQGLTYKQIAQHLSGGHPYKKNNIRAKDVDHLIYSAKRKISGFLSDYREK